MKNETKLAESEAPRLSLAEPLSTTDNGWGYMVTRDGNVVRVTEQHGGLIDDHGYRVETPIIEDRGSAGEVHRAA